MEAVACDPALSCLDQHVNLLLVTRFLNNESGDAWPSPETLAKALSASPSGIKKSLRRPCAKWWRQTSKGGGKGTTSRYAPKWETVPARSRQASDNPLQKRTNACPLEVVSTSAGMPRIGFSLGQVHHRGYRAFVSPACRVSRQQFLEGFSRSSPCPKFDPRSVSHSTPASETGRFGFSMQGHRQYA